MSGLAAHIRVESDEDLSQWVLAGAEDIANVSSSTCPVDTGALRASHSAQLIGRNHAVVTVSKDYASFVEYGTRFMAAQPYLGPAVDAILPALMQDLARKEAELRQQRRAQDGFVFLTAALLAAAIARLAAERDARERRRREMMERLGFGVRSE